MPYAADAQILVTDDGKYSGFIEKSGSQTLVFLPLSDGRCAKVAEELKLVFLPVEKAAESANTTEPDANAPASRVLKKSAIRKRSLRS